MSKIISRSAVLTVLTLFGGLLLGLLAGSLTFELIPGSSVDAVQLGHAAIAAFPALVGGAITATLLKQHREQRSTIE